MASSKRFRQKNFQNLNPQTHKYLFTRIASILLITAGAILVFFSSSPHYPTFQKPTPINENTMQISPNPQPVTLFIPKLKKTLNISPGKAEGDRWVVSQTGVSYFIDSALPGQNGNSVIYGHNVKKILGDLNLLEKGDNVYIVLDNGTFAKYQVFETKEVSPKSVDILDNSPDSRLTIYTCSGFLDRARFVVVAKS